MQFDRRKLGAVATLAAAAIAAALWACSGSGKATITVPTPIGPSIVDLWWCEEGQCVAATDPADTPPGVPMLASGVQLEQYAAPDVELEIQ